jgi:hypothetical protein
MRNRAVGVCAARAGLKPAPTCIPVLAEPDEPLVRQGPLCSELRYTDWDAADHVMRLVW